MTDPRVVLLRMTDGDSSLASGLAQRGYEPSSLVVGDVVDRPDDEVRRAMPPLGRFAWVAVTSRHAARRLAAWPVTLPEHLRVGAVGAATASVLRRAGVRCDLVAPRGTAASLADAIDDGPVLFVAGSRAREELPARLRARGIDTEVLVVYDVVPRCVGDDDLSALAGADAVVALSPSALDAVLEPSGGAEALERPVVVALGPTTADHARSRGVRVDAVAGGRGAEDLAVALRRALDDRAAEPPTRPQ